MKSIKWDKNKYKNGIKIKIKIIEWNESHVNNE